MPHRTGAWPAWTRVDEDKESVEESMASIELRHLRCFLAVADEGNVTRAAARLRLSQPAVSRALAALEKELGARLVDRSPHHLTLTGAGHAFRPKAATAVAAFDTALADGGGADRRTPA